MEYYLIYTLLFPKLSRKQINFERPKAKPKVKLFIFYKVTLFFI